MRESQLQIAVASYLDRALMLGACWFHVPNEGKRSCVTGRNLKRQGLKKGVPDCVIIYRGRAYFIELKTAKGRLQPEQKDFADVLEMCGAGFKVCRSLNEVQEALYSWGIPLKARIIA